MNDCNAMHRQALQNAPRAPARTADPELDDEATRSIRPDSDARGKGVRAARAGECEVPGGLPVTAG